MFPLRATMVPGAGAALAEGEGWPMPGDALHCGVPAPAGAPGVLACVPPDGAPGAFGAGALGAASGLVKAAPVSACPTDLITVCIGTVCPPFTSAWSN